MNYRDKIIYLLQEHNQNTKELTSIINNLQVPLNDIRQKISIIGRYSSVPEFVDLDLPSGAQWMKCNLGAKTETDYGLYFQFGSTEGKERDEAINFSTWKTCPGNGENETANEASLTAWDKSNASSKNVLKNGVDAVFSSLNGIAKLPTKEQIDELASNTTIYSYSNGLKFCSKKDPSKYIFIPTAGYVDNGTLKEIGSNVVIWSSCIDPTDAKGAYTLKYVQGKVVKNYTYRYYGVSIRGVLTSTLSYN